MRFLVVHPGPAYSVADVHDGWVDALRGLGQQVWTYNLDDRLAFYCNALFESDADGAVPGTVMVRHACTREQAVSLALNGLAAACYKTWPDVLLVVSGLFADHDLLDMVRDRGTRVVVLHTEEPYEHDRELALAGHADLNLVNDPTHLDDYRAVTPTWYVPHAYRPDRHHPRPADPALACDFAFVGTGYPSRRAFFEAVDWSGLTVRLGGNWAGLDRYSPLWPHLTAAPEDCMDNADAAVLYASAEVSANLYRREANARSLETGWAMGPREVELAAMGRFFLRDPRGEGDEVLPMLPAFAGPDDFGEQLRWWLARPAQRAEVAAKAQQAVAGRTFDAHARMLLRLLGD